MDEEKYKRNFNRKFKRGSKRMKPRILSREEEAKLTLRNKKVKDSHHADFNDRSSKGSFPRDNQNSWAPPKVSFKDKLVG